MKVFILISFSITKITHRYIILWFKKSYVIEVGITLDHHTITFFLPVIHQFIVNLSRPFSMLMNIEMVNDDR